MPPLPTITLLIKTIATLPTVISSHYFAALQPQMATTRNMHITLLAFSNYALPTQFLMQFLNLLKVPFFQHPASLMSTSLLPPPFFLPSPQAISQNPMGLVRLLALTIHQSTACVYQSRVKSISDLQKSVVGQYLGLIRQILSQLSIFSFGRVDFCLLPRSL